MTNVDIDKFKEALGINNDEEVDFDVSELVQNIHINNDGNIESFGGGFLVIMTQDYRVEEIAGGVSPDQMVINEDECDI